MAILFMISEKDNDSLNEKKGKGVYDAPESGRRFNINII